MDAMVESVNIYEPKKIEKPMLDFKMGCSELKNKLKQQYSQVTDEDLLCGDGRQKDAMLQALQRKLGKSGEELREIICNL